MCTIRRQYWQSRQYPSTIDQKPTSSPSVTKKTGLELSMAKCLFGVQEIDFLGRTRTTKVVAPQKQKIAKFLEKVNFSQSKKTLQRYIRFLNYYRNYIPRLAE